MAEHLTRSTTRPKGWYARNEIAITPWLFLIPAMIMFALYVVWPIGQSFYISLFKWDGLGEETEYVGLAQLRTPADTRQGFHGLALEQRQMAGVLSAGDPGGPVHRAVPEPNGARHPAL